MASKEAPTVAVVGLGALGIVSVKNLLEQGFAVTGFDGNEFVGGLWHYTPDDRTSVLESTVINVSSERGCFTDFPFPADSDPFVKASVVEQYLEDYVDHFKLWPHLRLSTHIRRVARAEEGDKWAVTIDKTGEVEYFDKVIMATGIGQFPLIPKFPGIEKFRGQTLHSRAFKKADNFKGRKVLVIGISNSGADTVVTLQGHAEKIYASHREGIAIMPRFNKGRPIDHSINVRLERMLGFLEKSFPSQAEAMVNKVIEKIMLDNFQIRPEWKLLPAPSVKTTVAVISDHLVDAFEAGTVESVLGIKEFTGPNEVELVDGTRLDIDTVIYCTGYTNDFSILDRSVDPTRDTGRWKEIPSSKGSHCPRLYRNVFSLDYPHSLAFMGCAIFLSPAFQLYDLTSMAIAQIWAGNSNLPPLEEMIRITDNHIDEMCENARCRPKVLHPGWVNGAEFMAWANDMAGTGINDKLGWGPEGLKFWLTNPKLCNLIMGGIYSPHIFRLFETGKRKAWPGAEEEIKRVNVKVAKATKERQEKMTS
ncbi:hypothetical protein jhhlp_002718 [Lomentospora prolificans]|uniref:FAD/NAD(P)-binding domain-containing protein n=1 Tax=Lomentospora prolificans TaxID=41688 RepID=A0A2N3NEU6_9PEZI|nr:hypothetical protein jhhlp_002718 [Lomentospora prolificans]